MKKLFIVACVIVGAGLVMSLAWLYFTTTPRYAIYKASQAIDDRDMNTFTKYVNLDSAVPEIASRLFESGVIKHPALNPNKPQERIPDPIEVALNKGIKEGSLADDFRPHGLIDAFTKVSTKTRNDESTAIVRGKSGSELVLKLKREKGQWKITGIDLSASKFR